MKKIAFMFAVAAMAVACGNEVALTAEDSAKVQQAVEDSLKAEVAKLGDAPVLDTKAENQDSAKKEFDKAAEKYKADTAKIFAGREAALQAGYEKALNEKKNAGDEQKNAGDEQKDNTEKK